MLVCKSWKFISPLWPLKENHQAKYLRGIVKRRPGWPNYVLPRSLHAVLAAFSEPPRYFVAKSAKWKLQLAFIAILPLAPFIIFCPSVAPSFIQLLENTSAVGSSSNLQRSRLSFIVSHCLRFCLSLSPPLVLLCEFPLFLTARFCLFRLFLKSMETGFS